ncbi:MAG TPA: methyltransferase domain-containing protein [Methylomirabilota bacterium]|jgi:ubiquinone/menaquinone biosynthesis C-methylase UbiE
MDNPAETYERYMVPVLFAPSAERMIEWARPRPGQRVLDVGCGTGIVARRAAACVGADGRITGVDASPGMLAVARAAATREGRSIDWRQGRAEALPFADGAFDVVLCQYALMFFADPSAALGEMRRVLAAGGRAMLSVWQGLDRHPFYQLLDRAIERQLGTSGVRDIFALGDAADLRDRVLKAGFRRVEIEPYELLARFPDPDGFLAGEIDVDTAAIPAMQHLDAAARADLTGKIRAEMAEPLRSVTVDGHVQLPFQAHLAQAER